MKTILFILLSITSCIAQENYKGTIIKYFTSDWKPSLDPNTATYFRTMEKKPDGEFIVRDYFSGSLQLEMESECHAYTPDLFREGKTTWYYPNGNLREDAYYKKNKKQGPVHTYYANGKLKGDLDYDEGTVNYKHVYDPFGQDYLVNGTGSYADSTGADDKNPIYWEIVDHAAFGSYMIENSDTMFLLVEQQAEYKGGLTQLGKDVGSRLTYPRSARRSGHSGTVYVAFTVTKKGNVTDAQVVKGFHSDCDAEALRVVNTLGVWDPGQHRGKKVNSKFVLPITFRLEG